jgi:hypothetical protein
MIDDDLEFERPTDELEPTPPPDRGPGRLIAGACVLAVALGLVAFLVLRLRPAPQATSPTPSPIAVDSGPPPPTADPTLPPLDQSDAFVRALASGVAADPFVASWLAGEGLIRRFVAVVVNIAQGEDPSPHLGFLAPRQGFHALYTKGRYVIDPDSYTRFDAFATAVSSVDAAGAARVYLKLRPLCDAAGRELGQPAGGIDAMVAQAIAALVATPVRDGDVPLAFAPPFYRFADRKLETLAPAQKQLLRMGPRNARAIQAKLRQVSEALSGPAAP